MAKKERIIPYEDVKESSFRGDRLQALRLEKGLTREGLWNELNCEKDTDGGNHNKTVENWENASNTPKLKDVIKIANFFDCDVAYFLNDSKQGIGTRTRATADACKELGLPEDTIRDIKSLDDELKRVLVLLTLDKLGRKTSLFRWLLLNIFDYSIVTEGLNKMTVTDMAGNELETYNSEITDFKRFTVNGNINTILDKMRGHYKKIRTGLLKGEIKNVKVDIERLDRNIENKENRRKWELKKQELKERGLLENGND